MPPDVSQPRRANPDQATQDAPASRAGIPVTAAALAEMARSGRSALWASRLSWVVLASGALNALLTATVMPKSAAATPAIGAFVASAPMMVLFALALRRLGQRAGAVARGDQAAPSALAEAHLRVLKTLGLLVLVSIAIALAIAVGSFARAAAGTR